MISPSSPASLKGNDDRGSLAHHKDGISGPHKALISSIITTSSTSAPLSPVPGRPSQGQEAPRPPSNGGSVKFQTKESVKGSVPGKLLPTPEPQLPEPQRPALVHRWIDKGPLLLPNLQNPRTYSHYQKITIVAVVAIASFCAPFASNILMPTFPFIGPALRLTSTGVTLTTTMFMIATGVGPLFHAFLSERFGRRPVYLGGFSLFLVASIACAVAPDGDDLIAYRFFQAFGCSAAQSVGMGTIADIYVPSERGRATGWWFLGPILGPMISPVVGGALYQFRGWRAVLWATVIFGFILLIMIFLLIPETSLAIKARQAASLEPPLPLPSTTPPATTPPPALSNSATHHSSRSPFAITNTLITRILKLLFTYLIRPWASLQHLLHPPIGLTALYASVVFACLYAMSTTAPFVFHSPPYNLHSLQISLTYLPACAGYVLGSIGGGYLSDWELRKAKEKYGEEGYPPESRLRSAKWGVPLVPAGMLLFGWGAEKGLHLAVPCIGGFIFGTGLMLTNGTIIAFFADVVPGQSASVVASYNAIRNVLAGLIAGVSVPACKNLRLGWFSTILAVLCLFSSLNLETVKRLGPYWRKKQLARLDAERAAQQAVTTANRT